ncbi:hypothetical protein ESCO105998_09460 [Escherichia coli]
MKVVEGARWFFLLGDLHCWIVPSFSLKAETLELNAEGLPDTILHSKESVVVNVQIFNVSMTIRRAGETLR